MGTSNPSWLTQQALGKPQYGLNHFNLHDVGLIPLNTS